jgi:ABC-type antimicrobial peptide transport system permease subunit
MNSQKIAGYLFGAILVFCVLGIGIFFMIYNLLSLFINKEINLIILSLCLSLIICSIIYYFNVIKYYRREEIENEKV